MSVSQPELSLPNIEDLVEVEMPSPEVQRKAALVVCDYAQDATLARELMEMLGLEVA